MPLALDKAELATQNSPQAVIISIVSHGHEKHVARLLAQLAQLPAGRLRGLVLTLNAPALDDALMRGRVFADTPLAKKLNLRVLRNPRPLGFGANHNKAFKLASVEFGLGGEDVFCIANPDIELLPEPRIGKPLATDLLESMVTALAQPNAGLTYPSQLDARGHSLDFERALATPRAIVMRQLGLEFRELAASRDWVSGAFMAFKASVFAELGGFDERYFMYCEDVDICLRLQLAGYALAKSQGAVIHHTQRQTLTNLRHLAWHLRSFLRLWRSDAYRDYLAYLACKKN